MKANVSFAKCLDTKYEHWGWTFYEVILIHFHYLFFKNYLSIADPLLTNLKIQVYISYEITVLHLKTLKSVTQKRCICIIHLKIKEIRGFEFGLGSLCICIFWHFTMYLPPLVCTFYIVNVAFFDHLPTPKCKHNLPLLWCDL